MITDVCHNVLLSILKEWSSVRAVCLLNSACCNKQQRKFIESVLLVQFSYKITELIITSDYDRLNFPKTIEVFLFVTNCKIQINELFDRLKAFKKIGKLMDINCLSSETSTSQLLLEVIFHPRSDCVGEFYLWSSDILNSHYVIHRSTKKLRHKFSYGTTTNGVFNRDVSQQFKLNDQWYNGWMRNPSITIKSRNGDIYSGQWNDFKLGMGTMTYHHDKSVYMGTWYDDQKSGFGRMTFQSGDVLEGTWRANQFTCHKECCLVLSNGDIYECHFIGGFLVGGRGSVKYTNGDRFDGHFDELVLCVKCGVKYCNCEVAKDGDWFRKLRSISGTRSFANGDERVIGSWTLPVRGLKEGVSVWFESIFLIVNVESI
jgi:hypothetical protein